MINYKGPLNYKDFKTQILDNSEYNNENVRWHGMSVIALNLLLNNMNPIKVKNKTKLVCEYQTYTDENENIISGDIKEIEIDIKDALFLYSKSYKKDNKSNNNTIGDIRFVNIKNLYIIFYTHSKHSDYVSLAIKNNEGNYYLLVPTMTVVDKDKVYRSIPAYKSMQIVI